jgi:hypothetical protein
MVGRRTTVSEHSIRRDQLPHIRKILEDIPFTGHKHPNDSERVIVEVESEYDYLVTKGVLQAPGNTPDVR